MSATLTLPIVLLIAFCISMEAIYQLCFKHAAHHATFSQTLVKPILWLGVGLWAVELLAWTNVLEYVPLSIAFPVMSLTYVTTLLASAIVFKEKVTTRHAMGALLIATGVACVGVTGI